MFSEENSKVEINRHPEATSSDLSVPRAAEESSHLSDEEADNYNYNYKVSL